MLCSHCTLIVIGLFVSSTVSHDVRHVSIYASTENEFELDYTKSIRAKELNGSSNPTTILVGGFQLAGEDDLVRETCGRIEDSFQLRTDCTCNLSVLYPTSTAFGCKNKHKICNQEEFCGRPVYTGMMGMDNTVFSSDFCLNNLQKGDEVFGNLCVTIDYSYNQDIADTTFLQCRAQIGKKKCNCDICRSGRGIRLDCTDIDNRLRSANCDVVDVVSKLDQDSVIRGYFPSFSES